MSVPTHSFEPQRHERELTAIIREIRATPGLDAAALHGILRKYPRDGRGVFSKHQLIRGFRFLAPRDGFADEESTFLAQLRMKPVRTLSGVAPVTVLTRPHPCPGRCIFCPNDVRMPKSYLAREPGAQRAAQHGFDPYGQTFGRLLALHHNGHRVDKVELIILGGTWSFYPEAYQVWFVKRCFDALNDFSPVRAARAVSPGRRDPRFATPGEEVDGRSMARTYNQVIARLLAGRAEDGGPGEDSETASWEDLAQVQRENEGSAARCVGLVVETRPDHLDEAEVVRIRRLGCTKVQIGFQSLDDTVLALNRRGHDVAATRRAVALLRQAGFKLHAHWMPNLYGSDPRRDVLDFERLFADPGFRPDELKIYPCSLIASAELMRFHAAGLWRPYSEAELLEVLCACLERVPPYCRVTRMIRDIPGDDIVTGNKITNFREVVERELHRRGIASQDIRAREVGDRRVDAGRLRLECLEYTSATGEEVFLQLVTPRQQLAGFCRLALPRAPSFVGELGGAAIVREVHVYGALVALGEQEAGRPQHAGLGRRLVAAAAELATRRGFDRLAVISSVGTREYYRRLGFADGELYQHRRLAAAAPVPAAGSATVLGL